MKYLIIALLIASPVMASELVTTRSCAQGCTERTFTAYTIDEVKKRPVGMTYCYAGEITCPSSTMHAEGGKSVCKYQPVKVYGLGTDCAPYPEYGYVDGVK